MAATQGQITIVDLNDGSEPGSFFEDWSGGQASMDGWVDYVGTPEMSIVLATDIPSGGGQALQVGNNAGNDSRWRISKIHVPYNPGDTYRVRGSLKRLLGTGTAYLGVAGVAADGVTLVNNAGANSYSVQHYCAASGVTPATFTEYTGYVSGSGTGGAGTLADPMKVHASARYIAFLIIVNYSSLSGTFQVGPLSIETIPQLNQIKDGGKVATSDTALVSMASDTQITVQEKQSIAPRWTEIYNDMAATVTLVTTSPAVAGEYKTTVDQAISAGIWTPATAGSDAKAYYDASEALRAYMFTAPGVLLAGTWATTITIVKATWLALWTTYAAARAGLAALTGTTSAGAAVPAIVTAKTPHYVGVHAYGSKPASANPDDTCTLYSTTLSERGIYKWSGTAWVRQAAPSREMIASAWMDVCGAINSGTYGAAADYIGSGAAFVEVLASNVAFINEIFAHDITATGKITGAELESTSGGAYTGVVNIDAGAIKMYGSLSGAKATTEYASYISFLDSNDPGWKGFITVRHDGDADFTAPDGRPVTCGNHYFTKETIFEDTIYPLTGAADLGKTFSTAGGGTWKSWFRNLFLSGDANIDGHIYCSRGLVSVYRSFGGGVTADAVFHDLFNGFDADGDIRLATGSINKAGTVMAAVGLVVRTSSTVLTLWGMGSNWNFYNTVTVLDGEQTSCQVAIVLL
jgi:hypothetical protein